MKSILDGWPEVPEDHRKRCVKPSNSLWGSELSWFKPKSVYRTSVYRTTCGGCTKLLPPLKGWRIKPLKTQDFEDASCLGCPRKLANGCKWVNIGVFTTYKWCLSLTNWRGLCPLRSQHKPHSFLLKIDLLEGFHGHWPILQHTKMGCTVRL